MITINARGARTIADSKPLIAKGQMVYVVQGTETAALMIGGAIVAERPVSEITCILDAQDWAYEVLDAMTAEAAEGNADNEAAAEIRAMAAPIAAEADKLEAEGTAPVSYRNSRGRKVTVTIDDPRHPARRAATLRTEAATLAAWTGADESAYREYVSRGIGDTDGFYAPLDRFGWKGSAK